MWIDKPLWDTDRDNDGGADVMLQMSGWDGLMVIAGLATGGAVNPAVAAGIMGGLSMAHSTANLAAGHLNVEQWGVEMLRSGVDTVLNMVGAGAVGRALGNLATSGLKVGSNGIDWSMSGQELATWGLSSLASIATDKIGKSALGKTLGGDIASWGVNQMAGIINNGWKSNVSGNLDWQLSENEWSEVGVDLAFNTVKKAVSLGFEGYGPDKKDSVLSYGLNKGLEMWKYDLYKNGTFREGIRNKYKDGNLFDLAGGLDLSLIERKYDNGYSTGVGLRFTSEGIQFHTGASEFSGLAIKQGNGWKWKGADTLLNDTMKVMDIGEGLGRAGKWIAKTVSNGIFGLGYNMASNNPNSPLGNTLLNLGVNMLGRLNDDQYAQALANGELTAMGARPDYMPPNDVELAREIDARAMMAFYQKHPDMRGVDTNNFNAEQSLEYRNLQRSISSQFVNKNMVIGLNVDVFNQGNAIQTNLNAKLFKQAFEDSQFNIFNIGGGRFKEYRERLKDTAYKNTVTNIMKMNDDFVGMQKKMKVFLGENNTLMNIYDFMNMSDRQIYAYGQEGKGNAYKTGFFANPVTGTNEHMNKDLVDDKLTMMVRNGDQFKIGEYYRYSLQSTNYLTDGKKVIGYDGKKHYPDMPRGRMYLLESLIRMGTTERIDIVLSETGIPQTNITKVTYERNLDGRKYHAFHVQNLDGTGNIDLGKPNTAYPDRNYVQAVLIHAITAESWITSHACNVMQRDDYKYFLKMFYVKDSPDFENYNGIYVVP